MVPVLLSILLVLFYAMQAEGRQLMPHDVHALVMAMIEVTPDTSVLTNDWSLVLNRCLAIAQRNDKGESFVACAVDAITKGDDDYLERWIMNRLNVAMGHRPHAYAGPCVPGGTMGHDVSPVSSVMAAEVGKGVVLGLRLSALRPLRQDLAAHQGMTSKMEPKGYTKDDIIHYGTHRFLGDL
jgi:hypothetical protein